MALNVTVDRRIVAEALDRAAGAELVALTLPADVSLDVAALLAALPGDARSLWSQPDAGLAVAASGVAARLVASATPSATQAERFASVPLAALRDRVTVSDPYGTGIEPRLIGGFAFFSDATWDAFGSGDLVLPELSYVRNGGRAAWVVVVSGRDPDPDPAAVVERVLGRMGGTRHPRQTNGRQLTMIEPERDGVRDVIAATIDHIRHGGLRKVVLARTATLETDVDVMGLVSALEARYPECAAFAFERSGEWFVGATPELLVRKQGSAVSSAALAATAPMETDPVLDRIELDSLRTSKQLEEHRLVVEAVVTALESAGVTTTVRGQQVMELRHVRHLATAIEGIVPEGIDILDLVGVLHPTPAVGGVPGSGALEWIRQHEQFVRGWYAAPVGVTNLSGDGEFHVALRSARIADGVVHLYAGAGIVSASEADAEMAEIDLKLGVMAGAVAAAR